VGRRGRSGRDHRGRDLRGGDAYNDSESFAEGEGSRKWGLVANVCNAMEEARPDVVSRGAGKDGVLEGFRLQEAAGAGGVLIGVPPGRVGGPGTLPAYHLMDSPCDELA